MFFFVVRWRCLLPLFIKQPQKQNAFLFFVLCNGMVILYLYQYLFYYFSMGVEWTGMIERWGVAWWCAMCWTMHMRPGGGERVLQQPRRPWELGLGSTGRTVIKKCGVAWRDVRCAGQCQSVRARTSCLAATRSKKLLLWCPCGFRSGHVVKISESRWARLSRISMGSTQ